MGLSTNVSNAYDLYRTRGTLTEPPDAPLRSAPPPLHTQYTHTHTHTHTHRLDNTLVSIGCGLYRCHGTFTELIRPSAKDMSNIIPVRGHVHEHNQWTVVQLHVKGLGDD